MTIPKLTPYTGEVANPDGSQTQSEFTTNMFNQLSYEADLAAELDATIDGINNAIDEVSQNAASAESSANAAEAAASSAGYQGLWPDTGGGALKGETWQTQIGGTPTGEYYTALQNTSVDPVSDNVNWKAQNDLNTGNLSDYTDIIYRASDGNSAVENMIAGIPLATKEGASVTTVDNNHAHNWLILASASSNKYSVSLDNGLFAILVSSEVEIAGLGASSGDDVTQLVTGLATAENVRKIKASGLDSVELTNYITISRDDVFIKLPTLTWTADFDLYPGGTTDRQVGIFTVTGSRDIVTPMLINSPIEEGDSTYSLNSTSGLVEGGFAVIIGGGKFNHLTRVKKISGNQVTLDYTSGWDESAGLVSIYSAEPVKNVHVMIDEIIDASGSTVADNQITGVTFLDSFQGSVYVGNAKDMANPVCLTRRSHSLYIPYMDNQNPRFTDSGRGYTLQMNGSLFCHTGDIKGTGVRHVIDWTRSAYCQSDNIYGTETAQIAVTTHGAYEHDITVNNIYTSKGCVGTLALANAGASFGERTKRFKINNRVVINGQFDIQNSEDIEINSARAEESDFIRINADVTLNDCDFSLCTSFRVRSRTDRDQKSVTINGGKYPDIELQGFSGELRAVNATMNWFSNTDTTIIPRRVKTINCEHVIQATSTLTVTEDVSLSSPFISVPDTASSIGVIVECKKLSITAAECENSPVISHDGANAKVFTVNGLYDVDPNTLRTTATLRARNVDGLIVNITGVTSEYSGSGDIVEFGRSGNSNIILNMNGNYLNGPVNVTSFGSVVKSIVTSNFVKYLTDLPSTDSNNAVANNIQI
ncbi:putative hemagglutinin protein [Vibrio phage ValSw3-3]|nr:putative hemagglutinin protein [Vibrio phage ValSw3-3]